MTQSKYVAPDRSLTAFHCPLCHVYSAMTWGGMYYAGYYQIDGAGVSSRPATAAKRDGIFRANHSDVFNHLEYAKCGHCGEATLWYQQRLLYPPVLAVGPEPVDDLPDDIKSDFNEARAIAARSPRGAAALLRLCIQKLCEHLGEKDGNLNAAIGNLVKKGLDAGVANALDIVRVIGAEAVHPLTMDLRDDLSTVERLLELVNYIADAMITQPARRAALFGKLPKDKLAGIKNRDRGRT